MVWKYKQRVRYSLEHRLLSNDTKRHHFNLTLRLPEAGRGLQDGVKGQGWKEKIGKNGAPSDPLSTGTVPEVVLQVLKAKNGV